MNDDTPRELSDELPGRSDDGDPKRHTSPILEQLVAELRLVRVEIADIKAGQGRIEGDLRAIRSAMTSGQTLYERALFALEERVTRIEDKLSPQQ